jgi:hypothetical protein
MIVDTLVEVKVSRKNIDHFSCYYKDINYGDIINIPVEQLQKNSNKRIEVSCDVCSDHNNIKYQAYNKNISSCDKLQIYTCVKCSSVKNKRTNLDKYGVDHYSKTDEYSDRVKKTSIKKYGVDHYSKTDEWSDRFKISCLEKFGIENPFMDNKWMRDSFNDKYGVNHPSKVLLFRNKMRETMMERYGVEYTLQSKALRESVSLTTMYNYGEYHHSKSDTLRANMLIGCDDDYINYLGNNISIFDCVDGHTFSMTSDNYHNRKRSNIPLCTVCNPIGDSQSIKEKILYEYIVSIYGGEVIQSHRDGLEIDIYLPELNIGFEFNGLYWHSEKYKDRNYHLNKTKYFQDKGIRIVHIWEDDWVNKQDILKSQISNILGLTDRRIFARKCKVIVVDVRHCLKFLDENHIQGSDKSTIKMGLEYEGELVSIMTFNKLEGRKKMLDGEWNLSRFCNKLGYSVVGGASKLLSYFVKEYGVTRIVSYADRDWSVGNLYEVLGFTLVDESSPDYKYVVDGVRRHKQNYKKSNLGIQGQKITEKQHMTSLGYHRIWDCGKIKYEIIT